MKLLTARAGVLVTVTGLVLLGAGVTTAQATKPAPKHKVTLCHRTASAAGGNQHNGYNIITVDIASVANAKNVRGHDSHEQQGNGPGGDIIPSFTYLDFTYPGKNLGGGGQAFLDRGCRAPIVVPEKPEPVVVVKAKDKIDCDANTVTTTTVTKTTDWILKRNTWVKDKPVVTRKVTTRETDAEDCPIVLPEDREPVVVVTHSDMIDCVSKKVTTTTVTTTTGWILKDDDWEEDSPVVVEDVTTRPTTAKECPVVPPVKVVAPPIKVLGVEAVAAPAAPAAPAPAAANPLPSSASAGDADTSAQLAAGALAGMAAFLMLGAGTVLRRRRGEV